MKPAAVEEAVGKGGIVKVSGCRGADEAFGGLGCKRNGVISGYLRQLTVEGL